MPRGLFIVFKKNEILHFDESNFESWWFYLLGHVRNVNYYVNHVKRAKKIPNLRYKRSDLIRVNGKCGFK